MIGLEGGLGCLTPRVLCLMLEQEFQVGVQIVVVTYRQAVLIQLELQLPLVPLLQLCEIVGGSLPTLHHLEVKRRLLLLLGLWRWVLPRLYQFPELLKVIRHHQQLQLIFDERIGQLELIRLYCFFDT